MNKSKKVTESKTVWINAITCVVAVAAFAGGQEYVSDHPAVASILAAIVAFGNIVLRLVTNRPIRVSK